MCSLNKMETMFGHLYFSEHRYIELFLNSVPGNRSDGMYQGDGDFDGDEDMEMFGNRKGGGMMRQGKKSVILIF